MSHRYVETYGVFHLSVKPGLPNVAILHGVYILEELRGSGKGHSLLTAVNERLRENHYDQAICTTAFSNVAMQSCLTKAGWSMLVQFKNRNSGKPHTVWGLTLSSVIE